ncbi:LOW QUALITY PROTEIN: hypothetical protein PHMEG_00020441 [Phytophthora megakarya]|uniref:HTH CENPB-type domain-containing protein n=1 Tax=Phytophthora megakarya TaxID=4795 RepID=A0A225VNW8_9STRA|nr:LOW QUALITY PROTEIN: hypothetical protein PHMEG_00020441 [Phytophthora megakarya]
MLCVEGALIEDKCAVDLGRHHRDRSCGLGTSLPTAAEKQLVRWFNDLRSDGVPAISVMIKLQALELYADPALPSGAFHRILVVAKALPTPPQLAMRGRNRGGQTTLKDAGEKLEGFSTKVLSKIKELKISKIYNADKTGVSYEYIPATTVSTKGAKTIKCAGKSKERVTAMLLDDNDGNKAKPFLVFETWPSKLAAKQNKICHHGFGSKLWSKLKGQQVGGPNLRKQGGVVEQRVVY